MIPHPSRVAPALAAAAATFVAPVRPRDRLARMSRAASEAAATSDADVGTFSDAGPWQIDPATDALARGRGRAASGQPGQRARAGAPAAAAAGACASCEAAALGGRRPRRLVALRSSAGAASARAPASRGGCAEPSSSSAPPTSSSGRSSPSGKGIFPDELVAEFKALPRPGAAGAVRAREARRGGGPRPAARRRSSRASTSAASRRRRSPRCTPRALRTGEDVVVKVQRPRSSGGARDIAAMAWIAPWLVGRHPGRGAGQPAAARRALRRDHRRGARLPARGRRTCSTSRTCCAMPDQTLIVVPRPHPELVTRRVLVMERLDGFDVRGRRGHARGGHRHRRGAALA